MPDDSPSHDPFIEYIAESLSRVSGESFGLQLACLTLIRNLDPVTRKRIVSELREEASRQEVGTIRDETNGYPETEYKFAEGVEWVVKLLSTDND